MIIPHQASQETGHQSTHTSSSHTLISKNENGLYIKKKTYSHLYLQNNVELFRLIHTWEFPLEEQSANVKQVSNQKLR